MSPKPSPPTPGCPALLATLLLAVAATSPATAGEPVTPLFSKQFLPDTIGPGSSAALRFDIDASQLVQPVTDLAFADTLPAGVVIATPSGAVTDCSDGVVSAPDGGGTITLSGGRVGAGASCSVTVHVTSSTPGTHTNLSGDLTSSAGNSGSATDDLVVATDRPGFFKSFAPSSVPFDGRSTLTFTIDNTANSSAATSLLFIDELPPGMTVAGPSDAATSCVGGTVSATPGTATVSLSGFFPSPSVAAGQSCTVTVDVTGGALGVLTNVSGELTSQGPAGGSVRSSGFATAGLEVTGLDDEIGITKRFVDDPTPPGGLVTLRFTIINFDRFDAATGITFSDDLDATLSGLGAVGLPLVDVCGAGSAISGVGSITLTGGNLAPEGSCVFDVTLQVPAGAVTGNYTNTTSPVTGDIGGTPVDGNAASDVLFVAPVPLLTKTFLSDPAGAGEVVTVEFSITNTSIDFGATDLAFQDNLSAFANGTTVDSLPAGGFCGAGSTATTTVILDDVVLSVAGASLPAGGSCTFTVDLLLPVGAIPGSFTNTTSEIGGTVDGEPVLGGPASDTLTIVGGASLAKSFTDDPVLPGDTVTLEFTLSHDALAIDDATAIAFTDDLAAVVPGLTAIGLPLADICGTGSSLTGSAMDTLLTFAAGTLSPGSSCTFSVTLQVPAGALPGSHANSTSEVVSSVAGVTATDGPASDDLLVAGLELTKEFTDDPALPGGTVSLEFTLTNSSAGSDATEISFTDDLAGVLSGLTATGLPLNDICGSGSSLTGSAGDTFLSFAGGSLTAGSSCAFSVVLQLPAGAEDGDYGNTTSALVATIEGNAVALSPAQDVLAVDSTRLELTKEFTDDPVSPGDTVTLRFVVTNLDAALAASAIAFADDLDATLSGLEAIGLPASDVCGAGSLLSGTSLVQLTGGALAAGASCTFDVTLQLPAVPLPGDLFPNTTSGVTGTMSGLPIGGEPASDTLRTLSLAFAKAFDGPSVAGGTPVLTFSLDNLSSASAASGLSFSDDLEATLTGLVATGLPLSDVCGPGSRLEGSGFLTLRDASLPPSGSCTFDVTLQVPAAAAPGGYVNVTSDLLRGGLFAADPATAVLSIEPPPTFDKSFAPDQIPQGAVSVLELLIDNSASAVTANGLDFTDVLPSGIVVATPPNASTTCTGGTLTAAAGAGVVSYAGGSVAAGGSCSVTVDVTGSAAGTYVNTTGDLTSSSGNSGSATDTLEVIDVTPPTVVLVGTDRDTGDGELEECETARLLVHALLVGFDEPMFDPGDPADPNAVTNPDNWRLVAAGPDRDITTPGCGPTADDDVAVSIDEVTYDPGLRRARLEVNGPLPLTDDPYRLFACSGGQLVDVAHNDLDGDGDGTGGDDFVRNFRVDRLDAFANGHLDCSIDSWTPSDPAAIQHDPDDVDDAGISGSAAFANPPGNVSLALAQCARVFPESIYELGGSARLDTGGLQVELLRTCELFASTDCSGAGLPSQVFFSLLTAPGVWESFADITPVPAGFNSALCQFTLRNVAAQPYEARLDDLSLDGLLVSIIFTDGFESGDTSAWSITVP